MDTPRMAYWLDTPRMAYWYGRAARREGKTVSDNPYSPVTEIKLYDAWKHGFDTYDQAPDEQKGQS